MLKQGELQLGLQSYWVDRGVLLYFLLYIYLLSMITTYYVSHNLAWRPPQEGAKVGLQRATTKVRPQLQRCAKKVRLQLHR